MLHELTMSLEILADVQPLADRCKKLSFRFLIQCEVVNPLQCIGHRKLRTARIESTNSFCDCVLLIYNAGFQMFGLLMGGVEVTLFLCAEMYKDWYLLNGLC